MCEETYLEMLRKYVKPFINRHKHPDSMLFLQDNARYHKTQAVMEEIARL